MTHISRTLSPRLAGQAFWSLTAWALPVAVVFVLTPPLLTLLGEGRFGVVMMLLLLPTIAIQLDLGVGAMAVRELAVDAEFRSLRSASLLAEFAVALLLAGSLAGATLWILAPTIEVALGLASVGVDAGLFRLCALWVAIAIAAQPPLLLARAMQRLKLLAAAQTLSSALLWICTWLVLGAGLPLAAVVWVGIGITISVSGLMLAALWTTIPSAEQPSGPWTGLTRERVRFAIGMLGTQVASALVMQADRYVVSAVAGPATAGAYAAVVNLANKVVAVVGGLTAFLYPHFAGLFGTGRANDVRAAVNAGERIALLIVLPTVAPVLVLAPSFVSLWLGPAGRPEMATALQVLYAGFCVSAVAAPIGHAVFGRGDSRFAAAFAWLAASTFVSAMIMLAPAKGLVGAATATALAMATSAIFQSVARRRLGIGRDAGTTTFALGLLWGCTVQAGLGILLRPWVSDWFTMLLVALLLWLCFFLARLLLGRVSPEERLFLSMIRSRLAR